MQVHHDEGIANRIDPESCAVAREGFGEALTGDHIGQPLSREMSKVLGADALSNVEGNTDGRVNRERPDDPAWSETLACADASCAGTGRSHASTISVAIGAAWSASGRHLP